MILENLFTAFLEKPSHRVLNILRTLQGIQARKEQKKQSKHPPPNDQNHHIRSPTVATVEEAYGSWECSGGFVRWSDHFRGTGKCTVKKKLSFDIKALFPLSPLRNPGFPHANGCDPRPGGTYRKMVMSSLTLGLKANKYYQQLISRLLGFWSKPIVRSMVYRAYEEWEV